MLIVSAALQLADGSAIVSLPRPARHHNIISSMTAQGYALEQICSCEQGFLTDAGLFVDRKSAWAIALAAGQIAANVTDCPGMLFSEDVW